MPAFLLRLLGFAGAPILSALAPFLVLPLISRVAPEAWGDFSAAQSIGLLGMVGVLFGWSVSGPVLAARAAPGDERAVVLRESLRTRAITASVVVPVVAVIAVLVVNEDARLLAAAVAVAMALSGFTPAWFCIGEGNPRGLIIYDAVPKLIASALSLALIAATQQVIWYPILFVLAILPAYAVHARSVLSGHDHAANPLRSNRALLRAMVTTAAVDATGNAYGSTPTPIVNFAFSRTDSGGFASADRVYRVGLLAVVALGNAFQAWVLDRTATDRPRRHRIALVAQVALGIIGAAGLAVLGPWATTLVFGPDATAPAAVCLMYGLAFLFISSSTPLIRNILIPAGRARTVFIATVVAAVAGLGVMLTAAAFGSLIAVASGIAVSEAIVLVVLLSPAIAVLRQGDEPREDDEFSPRSEAPAS